MAKLIQVVRRGAETFKGLDDTLVVVATSPIGFAGAADDDRQRWLNSFRRLIDGLDAPLQVVIDVAPGSDDEPTGTTAYPVRFADMRGADLAFADDIRRSSSSHCITTSLVTTRSTRCD